MIPYPAHGRPEVVLCYPLFDKVFFTEPVGICLLASYLNERGIPTNVDDGFLRGDSAIDVAKRVASKDPIAVGISMNAEREVPDGLKLASELHISGYTGIIIAGGAFAAMARHKIMHSGLVDYVVVGDGEEVLAEVVGTLKRQGAIEPIPGLASKGDDYRPRVGIRDLDAVPPMDRSVFKRLIAANNGSLLGIQATISTGRGCYANCAFCSIQTFAGMNRGARYRERSIRRVVNEMEMLHADFGIKDFYFCTGQFLSPGTRRAQDRVSELRNEVAKLSFTPSIFLYIRCDNVKEEIVRCLRQAGVTTLFLGVESFDDRVLERLQKGLTANQIIVALEELQRQGYSADYRSRLRLKFGFIMFTPWVSLDGLEVNARNCRRFRIPPKKMLYSLQLHPENQISGTYKIIEHNAVHFIDLEGEVGDVYRAYSDFFSAVFVPLERMRAYQKATLDLPPTLTEASWRVVDGLNEIAYDTFDAIVDAARSGRASVAGVAGKSAVVSFLSEVSFDKLEAELAEDAQRFVCVQSHFNRGYDNPQILDPRSAELGLRYP